MEYRRLPPARSLEDLETVRRAVPRDPAGTDDCCGRVCERTFVQSRRHASEWLVFLRALGCVADDGDGYYRKELPAERLGSRFESRVFGASAVLAALEAADGPLTSDELADRLAERTRRRLDRSGTAYLDRLLDWAVVLGRIEDVDGRYAAEPA